MRLSQEKRDFLGAINDFRRLYMLSPSYIGLREHLKTLFPEEKLYHADNYVFNTVRELEKIGRVFLSKSECSNRIRICVI